MVICHSYMIVPIYLYLIRCLSKAQPLLDHLRSQQHGEWQRSVESMLRSIEQQLTATTATTAATAAPPETLETLPETLETPETAEGSRTLPKGTATGAHWTRIYRISI